MLRVAEDPRDAQGAQEQEVCRQYAQRGENGQKVDDGERRERVSHERTPAWLAAFQVVGHPTKQVVEREDVNRRQLKPGHECRKVRPHVLRAEHERHDAQERDCRHKGIVGAAERIVFLGALDYLENPCSHKERV